MNTRTLARRSLRHYFRSHLGVLAGVTLAAAVLIGALVVGDSVQGSLRERALQRLGATAVTLSTGDRFFDDTLLARMAEVDEANPFGPLNEWRHRGVGTQGQTVLRLAGMAAQQDGSARANRITVLGVDGELMIQPSLSASGAIKESTGHVLNYLKQDEVWLNVPLATQLNAKRGDQLVLRLNKPSALSRDSVVTPRDDLSVALRLKVGGILEGTNGGLFSLEANQAPALNAFVPRSVLANAVGLQGRANLLLLNPPYNVSARTLSLWHASLFQAWLKWFPGKPFPGWLSQLLMSNPLTLKQDAEFAQVLTAEFPKRGHLADLELGLKAVIPDRAPEGGVSLPPFAELTTRRIFLEPAVVRAALVSGTLSNSQVVAPAPTPLLTYLVNSLSHDGKLTPYSMVTAVGAPYTPADLKDDEIVVNQWLADDLGVKPGDVVALAYYRVDAGTQLVEHTNTFRVRSVVPLAGLHADRTLMPEFPGLAKADSTHDWDAGFELVHTIRDKDEAYWKQHRGAPKAFISLGAGQKLWANRFGDVTAIRWFEPAGQVPQLRDALAAHIRANLNPADVGLVWRPVREEALRAAESGTGKEFGGLMIGFSFFLITSALLLTAMLFRFALEQRTTETGILLALGWQPGRVRWLLFREGLALAVLGAVFGAVLGVYYAKGVLWGLTTIWRDAIAGAGLEFHLTATTLFTGIAMSIAVAAGTMFLALRQQAKRPARELLNEGANAAMAEVAEGGTRRAKLGVAIASILALGMAGAAWAVRETKPEMFFGAGALLLIAGLLWARLWLRNPGGRAKSAAVGGLRSLALRALARRPSRSLGTVALLASAAFLIVAVAANKLDATQHAERRGSGTGGFALWGESSLPVIQDLNTTKGQEFYGLNAKDLKTVSFVQMRVRDGDDASCLNLNRAQRPRLLGVNPEQLAGRGAFTFTKVFDGLNVTNGWLALGSKPGTTGFEPGEIAAIGDAASIQWALQTSVGGTLDYVDERGQPFKVRIVGAVANSILQGNLLIAEQDFVRLFPSESGYRGFLVDAPANATDATSAALSRALQDVGLELTPTTRRLAQFNSVQNTYLNTFQILGGLGLLLGSVGLGVVVLRNVHERRGELGLMLALGFERGALKRLVLTEHIALLLLGLAVGTGAALVAVLPALGSPGVEFPWISLAITLGLVLANGLLWTVWAAARSLRGRLVDSLRDL